MLALYLVEKLLLLLSHAVKNRGVELVPANTKQLTKLHIITKYPDQTEQPCLMPVDTGTASWATVTNTRMCGLEAAAFHSHNPKLWLPSHPRREPSRKDGYENPRLIFLMPCSSCAKQDDPRIQPRPLPRILPAPPAPLTRALVIWDR